MIGRAWLPYVIAVFVFLTALAALFALTREANAPAVDQASSDETARASSDALLPFAELPEVSFATPAGWYKHQIGVGSTILTRSEAYAVPKSPAASYASPFLSVVTMRIDNLYGVRTKDEWLERSGLSPNRDPDDYIIEWNETTLAERDAVRVRMRSAHGEGDVLIYAIFPDDIHVVMASMYPYETKGATAHDFELLTSTLDIE